MPKIFVDEQKETDKFVKMVGGVSRADQLQRIWNMHGYPHGTQYDKVFRPSAYSSPEQSFANAALREGYTPSQIRAFLRLGAVNAGQLDVGWKSPW